MMRHEDKRSKKPNQHRKRKTLGTDFALAKDQTARTSSFFIYRVMPYPGFARTLSEDGGIASPRPFFLLGGGNTSCGKKPGFCKNQHKKFIDKPAIHLLEAS